MPIAPDNLKATVRAAIQVAHIEVEDNSSGCGDNFSVLIVSRVMHMLSSSLLTTALNCDMIFLLTQEFEGKTMLARHRMGIIWLSSLVAFHPFSRFQPTQ
jgi:stress-induced morphogen